MTAHECLTLDYDGRVYCKINGSWFVAMGSSFEAVWDREKETELDKVNAIMEEEGKKQPKIVDMLNTQSEDWIARIPMRLKQGLVRYREEGIKPGDALKCLLENDLRGFTLRADNETWACARELQWWLGRFMPPDAYRTPQKVQDWIEDRGLKGYMEDDKEWVDSWKQKVNNELDELGRESEL